MAQTKINKNPRRPCWTPAPPATLSLERSLTNYNLNISLVLQGRNYCTFSISKQHGICRQLTAIVPLRIADTFYEELLTMKVIETASFSLIFGMPWLRRQYPTNVDFSTLRVTTTCLANARCIPVCFDQATTDTDDAANKTDDISAISNTIDSFLGYTDQQQYHQELVYLPPINQDTLSQQQTTTRYHLFNYHLSTSKRPCGNCNKTSKMTCTASMTG